MKAPRPAFTVIPLVSDLEWKSLTRPKDRPEVRRVAEALSLRGFRRNEMFVHPEGRILLQFARADVKINVEVNGVTHARRSRSERDEKRDAVLHERGWTVIRVRRIRDDAWILEQSGNSGTHVDQTATVVLAAVVEK